MMYCENVESVEKKKEDSKTSKVYESIILQLQI